MKIVLIHGQNHQGSSCHIGRMIANKVGVKNEISEFFLPRDLEHFCLGCYQCVEEEQHCPFYTEKNKIMSEVEKADLLILTTPTYCLRASAPMKTFIDLTFTYWMTHRPRAVMFQKKAVVVSAAAGAGTKSAIKDIVTALSYWGISNIERYGISVQAMNWEQVSPKIKSKIDKETTALAHKVKYKKAKAGIKTKAIFYMMRLMQKKDWSASPVEKDYWKQQGWLDKERPWKNKKVSSH